MLRTRRGLGLLAFATVMTIACVLLGLWQLDRYQQRGMQNEAIRTALAAEPVAFDSLVGPEADLTSSQVPDSAEWRRVELSGTYDDSATLVLRLRALSGQSGVHVLTPLVLPDGRAVLVDRGFLPAARGPSGSVESAQVPEAPAGTVDLTARVRLSEDAGGAGLDDDTSPPSVRFVDLDDLADALDGPVAPVWVERVEQVPSEDSTLVAIPAPGLSAGPSLIYAVQWFLFGVIAVVGFVVLVRRDSQPPALSPHPGGRAARR